MSSSPFYFYDPFEDFGLGRLVDEPFNTRFIGATPGERRGQHIQRVSGTVRPKMDLHENKENNTVTAAFELPGLAKENLDVSIHDGCLTISGENKISSEHEESGYTVRERRFGKYSRTIQLPPGVTEDQVNASFENGVLLVTFPKSMPHMAPKKVTIA